MEHQTIQWFKSQLHVVFIAGLTVNCKFELHDLLHVHVAPFCLFRYLELDGKSRGDMFFPAH